MTKEEIREFLSDKIAAYGLCRFCRDANISMASVSFWKHNKRGLNMGTLEMALDVLGYEIVIQRKRSDTDV